MRKNIISTLLAITASFSTLTQAESLNEYSAKDLILNPQVTVEGFFDLSLNLGFFEDYKSQILKESVYTLSIELGSFKNCIEVAQNRNLPNDQSIESLFCVRKHVIDCFHGQDPNAAKNCCDNQPISELDGRINQLDTQLTKLEKDRKKLAKKSKTEENLAKLEEKVSAIDIVSQQQMTAMLCKKIKSRTEHLVELFQKANGVAVLSNYTSSTQMPPQSQSLVKEIFSKPIDI